MNNKEKESTPQGSDTFGGRTEDAAWEMASIKDQPGSAIEHMKCDEQ